MAPRWWRLGDKRLCIRCHFPLGPSERLEETHGRESWEKVIPHGLHRVRVPGGWLYKTLGDDGGVALAFVPDAW